MNLSERILPPLFGGAACKHFGPVDKSLYAHWPEIFRVAKLWEICR